MNDPTHPQIDMMTAVLAVVVLAVAREGVLRMTSTTVAYALAVVEAYRHDHGQTCFHTCPGCEGEVHHDDALPLFGEYWHNLCGLDMLIELETIIDNDNLSKEVHE